MLKRRGPTWSSDQQPSPEGPVLVVDFEASKSPRLSTPEEHPALVDEREHEVVDPANLHGQMVHPEEDQEADGEQTVHEAEEREALQLQRDKASGAAMH